MSDFLNALTNAGIDPGGELVEGHVTRATCSCSHHKKNKNGNGFYTYYPDDPAVITWGCWKEDCANSTGGKYSPKTGKTQTPEEREAIKARAEKTRQEREVLRQELEVAVREKAARLWETGRDVLADHPYIAKKGVTPKGIKQVKDMLIIPMSETGSGTPASMQLIFPDGSKKFLTGTGAIPETLYHVIKGTGGTLYVVEGYATGLSVNQATGASVVVAFSSGRLSAVAQVLRNRFPSREVVIAGDSGNGSGKAIEAAKLIGGKVAIPAMPEGVTGTDWNDLHTAVSIEEVTRQLATAAAPVEEEPSTAIPPDTEPHTSNEGDLTPGWEQPLLFGEIETPALSVSLFPTWLREYCQAVIDSTQTPPDMTVMMALSVLAACLQKRFEVAPFADDHREPLALWTVTALDPGNRKTAVTGALTFPLTAWENEQQKKLLPRIREVESKRATLEKRISDLITRAAKLDNKNERDLMLVDVNRLKEEMPDEMKPPLIWTDDTTPERLQGLLVENGERIALLSDEGGIFEIMAGLYSNGRANLNIFLKGHAGSECRAERQGRSARLESPCLTFGLAVQPDVISDLAQGDKKRFRGNGTLARFLYCLPKSTIGDRDVTRRDGMPESLRARYQAEIDGLLNIAPVFNECGKEQPRILTLDKEARQSWLAFSQFIESNLGRRGELVSIQDWASKLPGATVRIAGLLHVAEYGTDRQEITNGTMTAVLDLAELLIKHTQAAFALMGDDEAVKDAKDVLRWIIEEQRESFRQRDCQRALQRLNLERLERAVKVLAERHMIGEPEKQPGGKGKGKPSVSYAVNPAIFEMKPLRQ